LQAWVVGIAAIHEVVAEATLDGVGARFTVQRVVAITAIDEVVAVATD
jgi:hypothetical protein